MEAVVGVLIGGGISLAATIAADTLRSRRERRHYLDAQHLARMSEFLAAANETIGKLHDRGISQRRDGPESERFLAIKSEARDTKDALRAARSNAAVTDPTAGADVDAFMERLRDLDKLAEAGFDKHDDAWARVRDALSDQIKAISNRVRADIAS